METLTLYYILLEANLEQMKLTLRFNSFFMAILPEFVILGAILMGTGALGKLLVKSTYKIKLTG